MRVTLRVRKHGFTQYLLESALDEFVPMACDRSSSIQKSAVITFGPNGDVDVLDLKEFVDIREGGRLLPAESFRKPIPPCPRPVPYCAESAPAATRTCICDLLGFT